MIYLDNSATTNVTDKVIDEMLPYFKMRFYNPSAMYDGGMNNRKIINNCRRRIASLLHCDYKEIYFTSGGSESDNWAIKGYTDKHPDKREIITTKIEHHAVLNTVKYLETKGYTIRYVNIDNEGLVDLEHLKSLVNQNTAMISIHFANNEIGTIQPIKAISDICHANNIIFHTDAVQAAGHIPIDVTELGVDMMSISAHKFHGPKGIGLLYIKDGIQIENLIHGGQQENKKRAGTENIPYIIGMTKALELAVEELDEYQVRLRQLSVLLYEGILKEFPTVLLNGPASFDDRLPGNVNIAFKGLDAHNILYNLNKRGVYASASSACDSDSIEPSHVIQALKIPNDYLNGVIRFSLGSITSETDISLALKKIIKSVKEEL